MKNDNKAKKFSIAIWFAAIGFLAHSFISDIGKLPKATPFTALDVAGALLTLLIIGIASVRINEAFKD